MRDQPRTLAKGRGKKGLKPKKDQMIRIDDIKMQARGGSSPVIRIWLSLCEGLGSRSRGFRAGRTGGRTVCGRGKI